MPVTDFYECMMIEALEPFGDRRLDVHAALICSMVATMLTGKVHKPADFMPKWDSIKPVRKQSPQEQMNIMLGIQATQRAMLAKKAQKNG